MADLPSGAETPGFRQVCTAVVVAFTCPPSSRRAAAFHDAETTIPFCARDSGARMIQSKRGRLHIDHGGRNNFVLRIDCNHSQYMTRRICLPVRCDDMQTGSCEITPESAG
jgi:hypothetical protein